LKVSEAEIQRACIEYLRLQRWPDGSPAWEVYETHTHHAYASAGEPGQPDVVAVHYCTSGFDFPVILRLEMKVPGKYATKIQRDWAIRHGVAVYTIRSLEDLKAIVGGK
jgi:hypothetical protein